MGRAWIAYLMILLTGILLFPPGHSNACSILTLRDDDTVLMGNNEDWKEPGYLWFEPNAEGRYGRVNVGFRDRFVQGSMNEKGLSFDAAVVPDMPWREDPEKETPDNLLEKIMNECATVEQAISYFEKYNCSHLSRSQFLFADATGDSAIVTWRPEGGLSLQRIDGRHQIATNTRLEGTGYRCQRYTKAEQVLASRREVSIDTVAETLQALHQRGPFFTTYSTVYDLKAKTVSVFNLTNFDEVVTFDLMRELAKKPQTYKLAKLFDHSPDIRGIRKQAPRTDFGTRVSLSDATLEKYTGFYSPLPEVRVRVLRDADGLRVENPGQPAARLFPESERVFRIAPDRGQVTFELAPDGRVTGLTLHKLSDVFARRVGDLELPGTLALSPTLSAEDEVDHRDIPGVVLEVTTIESEIVESAVIPGTLHWHSLVSFKVQPKKKSASSFLLSGRVVSNNTGLPSKGLPIYFGSDLHRPRLATSTDTAGQFRFKVWLKEDQPSAELRTSALEKGKIYLDGESDPNGALTTGLTRAYSLDEIM